MTNRALGCLKIFLFAWVGAALSTGTVLARQEKLGKGEGAVDIVAWPGYIERGDERVLAGHCNRRSRLCLGQCGGILPVRVVGGQEYAGCEVVD
ncbi:MAG: hypothetical protein ACKVP2_08840, partial [Burkholderiales bacterium]